MKISTKTLAPALVNLFLFESEGLIFKLTTFIYLLNDFQ